MLLLLPPPPPELGPYLEWPSWRQAESPSQLFQPSEHTVIQTPPLCTCSTELRPLRRTDGQVSRGAANGSRRTSPTQKGGVRVRACARARSPQPSSSSPPSQSTRPSH